MMKIHTTQNLNSLVQGFQSTNSVSSKDFRLKNYSEQMPLPECSAGADFYSTSVSFGKGPTVKDGKKIVKMSKKMVGDIAKESHPRIKGEDKFIEHPLFNWALSKYDYEPVIQAAAAGIICMALRPATIMALPAKDKNKEDNIYASSHSFASGMMGLVAAIIVTAPFKTGSKYVMEVLRKDFKTKTLQDWYPQLDINSIWADKAKGIRKPIKEWLNKDGNAFIDNVNRDIQFLPEFKQLSEISDLTYKDVLKLDVDWASQKGKSFNDVVLKDGNKLYDKINMSNIGIVVEEEGYNKAQILLQDLDKEFFSDLIKDSKGNNWGNIDIKSVYDEKGIVKDFREWKDINGNQWKLDLDEIYISSPLEEIAHYPRISGKKRFDQHDKEYKYITYQDNGKNGRLGTEINENMVEVARANEGIDKMLTWGPDIVTRIPIAATTIALIPWTLKHIFGIEKAKKGKNKQAETIKDNPTEIKNDIQNNKEITFKGKNDKEEYGRIIKWIGKHYGKPIMESDRIRNIASKLSQLPGKLTQHMMTLGSFITSSVYMTRTLQNTDLDPERKKTLAVNQGLCFLIPTIAAYTVDLALDKKIKKFEYRISNKGQYEKAMAEYTGRPLAKWYLKNKGNVKGLRILTSIGIFSLIYRYITPVVVTPLANWISDTFFTNDNKNAHIIKLDTSILNNDANEQTAQEISIDSKDKPQARQSA